MDLSAVATPVELALAEEIELPAPPPTLGPAAASQPALPAQTVTDASGAQIAEARRLIEEDRRLALRSLDRRLSRVYVAIEEARGRELLVAFKPRQQSILDDAYDRLREVFEDYAEKRWPLVTRLEFLQTPGNRFGLTPDPTNPLVLRRREERESLRKSIDALEAQYQSDSRKLLDEAKDTINRELTALTSAIESRKLEAQNKASADAAQQIRARTIDLNSDVRVRGRVQVDPVGQRSAEVAGVSPIPDPPKPITNGSRQLVGRETLIRQQLEIWLRVNGYQWAKARENGRDATQEFKEWRTRLTDGP